MYEILGNIIATTASELVMQGIGFVTRGTKELIEKKTAVPVLQLTGKISREQKTGEILDGEETFDLGADIDPEDWDGYDTITLDIKNIGNCAVKEISIDSVLVYLASAKGFKSDLEMGAAENYLILKHAGECEHRQKEISLEPGETKSINLVFSDSDFNENTDDGELGESVFVGLALEMCAENGVYEQDAVCCTYKDGKAYKPVSGDVIKKGKHA